MMEKGSITQPLAIAYGVTVYIPCEPFTYCSDVKFYPQCILRIRTPAGGWVKRKYATSDSKTEHNGQTGRLIGKVRFSFLHKGNTYAFCLDANWWYSDRIHKARERQKGKDNG